MNLLAIFIGGGMGSILRYSLSVVFQNLSFFKWPWATFVSNISSSLIVGILVGFFLSKNIESLWMKNLLLIGFCGGFSTFSTFGLESFRMIENNQFSSFLIYAFSSIAMSIFCIYLGLLIFEKT